MEPQLFTLQMCIGLRAEREMPASAFTRSMSGYYVLYIGHIYN